MAWAFYSELGEAALLKAVCWNLRLASLLTHLFICLFIVYLVNPTKDPNVSDMSQGLLVFNDKNMY